MNLEDANLWRKVVGTRIDTLERLLDVYVEIGDVIPNLHQYDKLFSACPPVREVLERYWDDILRFHRKALDFLARPGTQIQRLQPHDSDQVLTT